MKHLQPVSTQDHSSRRLRAAPLWTEQLEPRVVLAAGDLDVSFDGDGIASLSTVANSQLDFGRRVAVAPDGKVVVAGTTQVNGNPATPIDIVLSRFNSNGTLDTTFDSDGMRTVSVVARDSLLDLLVQPDGKMVIATRSAVATQWTLMRLTPEGLPDSTFDGDGVATLNFTGMADASLFRIALDSSGKIIGVGTASQSGVKLALGRFNADGSVDTTFDSDGFTTVAPFSINFGTDITISSDGKIVVSAYGKNTAAEKYSIVIARFLNNGTPDASFASAGFYTQGFTTNYIAASVHVDGLGRVSFAGTQSVNPSTSIVGNLFLGRLTESGQLDAFGTDASGMFLDPVSRVTTQGLYDLAVQPDGRLLVAGEFVNGTSPAAFQAFRFTSAGELDSTFGTGGVAKYTATAPVSQQGTSATLSPDGSRLLIAGVIAKTSTDYDLQVMSLLTENTQPPPSVTAATFRFEDRQSVKLTFSDFVMGFDLPDLQLQNLNTGASYSAPLINYQSNPGIPSDGEWVFNGFGTLPDGNYRATLPAIAIVNAAGFPMAADFTFDFHILAGDANRDRVVNFDDLLILAQNYGLSGRTFSQGNFNYSAGGQVNFDDLLLLAQKYGSSLSVLTLPRSETKRSASGRASLAERIIQ